MGSVGHDLAVICLAFGLRIDSEFILPIPSINPAAYTGVTDVQLRAGIVHVRDVTFASLDGVEDADAVWMDQGWDDGRVVLVFPGVVAELRLDRPIILVDVRHDDDDYVAHIVLDHVVPRWLALHGVLVLHAGSCVTPSGQGVVFVGNTGQGKSSLVTALGQLGWPLLGDDACRMVRSGDDWYAQPSYPGVRLTGKSRAALVPSLESWPMARGSDKRRVVPAQSLPALSEFVPVGLVVELGGEQKIPTARPLTLSESTAVVARHSFHLAPSEKQVAPQAFTLSSALAAAVPCVRLDFPRTWDVYPELIAMIDAFQASLK